jgi:hypothetical protein
MEEKVPPKTRSMDIRSFRAEKNPTTDVQMAAVVAYYLAELAPLDQRKTAITPKDITEYFKQAGHPLPKAPKIPLWNARAAGYFNSDGHGNYTLNPVGHNLVAHNLPTADSEDRPKRPSKTAAKRASKKVR